MSTPIYDEMYSVWRKTREAASAIARIEELTAVLELIDAIAKPTIQVRELRATLNARLDQVVKNGKAQ